MKRIAVCAVALLCAASLASASPTRQMKMRSIDLGAGVPADLRSPEGKSRWNLTGVTLGAAFVISHTLNEGDVLVSESAGNEIAGPKDAVPAIRFHGSAAQRWSLPDRGGALRIGDRETLELEESGERGIADLFIDVATVGIGWVELPSGPREVVLQRASVLRRGAGASGFAPDRFLYRWVDPRAGVVAEASGPATADGRGMTSLDRASVLEEVITGGADLKIYVDQLYRPDFVDLNWGWDRGAVPVSSLTPDGHATIGALINANSWDFSNNASGMEVAQHQTPSNTQETCNINSCGYNFPGASLGRQDKYNSSGALVRKDNQVTVREDRPSDVTIWARAGAQKEETAGGFGTGETRYCYVTDAQRTRNPVPLWRFSHQDAGGWYMAPPDAWAGGPGSSCQQTLFNGLCGDTSGLFSTLYAKSCNGSDGQPHAGTQSGAVLKTGVVKIPSGHTLNAQLIRTVGDFCVYGDSSCFLKLDEARTVVYLWSVPYLGTVVLLQSVQNASSLTGWTQTENTIIKYGLMPPVSISASGSTGSTVSLSWNPGNDTRRIARYKIYWDTDSGASNDYAFNSDTHPGQVAFSGTTATISGLSAGTTYYFTVTSISDYTDPTRNSTPDITRTYESIRYPTQVSGDPSFVYPVEVQAATTGGTCVPTAVVNGVTVNKVSGQYEICWNPASDPCLQGYDILGAPSPQSANGFSIMAQVGAATCWQGNPANGFFIVVARGTGASGPWGHYGQ